MHIAIAFDKNYLHPFYALSTSILCNNPNETIHFHLIATGISQSETNKIEDFIKKFDCQVFFYSINPELLSKFVLFGSWSAAVYYRLFFPLLIPLHIHRLLYLDCDTIVNNSLKDLFEMNLDNFIIGAVADNYVNTQPLLGLNTAGEYFNSGVLLIDTVRWRKENITSVAIDFLLKYPKKILFVDQCALNAVLYGRWKPLHEKYNLLFSYVPDGMSAKSMKLFLRDKVVIHFTLQRPWQMLCRNRLSFLYFKYLKLSPAGGEVKKYDDFELSKLPMFIKIRLLNFYHDIPFLQSAWQKFKQSI